MKGLDTYVINLDRSPERLMMMCNQLQELKVEFQRISAIDGKAPPDWLNETFEKLGAKGLTLSEYACTQSHRMAWHRIISSGKAIGLVLEDDVHISCGLPAILEQCLSSFPLRSIVRLEATPMISKYHKKAALRWGSYHVYQMETRNTNAAAYLIDRAAAEVLGAIVDNLRLPVDFLVADPEALSRFGIRLYQIISAPCIQDEFATSSLKRGLHTSIVHTSGDAQPRTVSFARRAYQALHSRLLLSRESAKWPVGFG